MTKQYNIKYKEWLKDGRDMNIITIFTPTYNRANLIQRVYKCLLNQTDKRFVWILVNDGSKDNSDEVAEEILEKNELPILFISKSNGGKHSAFEVAFNEVRTEYFMCMDDDDIYSPKAVATYLGEWDYIKQENKFEKIGAIRTITQEEDGTIVSRKPFNKSFLGTRIDQTTLESNYIKHEYFENWTCYRTGALHSVDLFRNTTGCTTSINSFLKVSGKGVLLVNTNAVITSSCFVNIVMIPKQVLFEVTRVASIMLICLSTQR